MKNIAAVFYTKMDCYALCELNINNMQKLLKRLAFITKMLYYNI